MMMTDIVKVYISQYLIPRLKSGDLSEEQIHIITDDISLRLKSLLASWHDKNYLIPLFEIVKEEAFFYDPKSSIFIKTLVVLGIRNSCLEDAHSTEPFNPLLKTQKGHMAQSSKFIREITSEAISFFKKELKLNDNFSSIYHNTLFKTLDKKYPRTWQLLESVRQKKGILSLENPQKIPAILEHIKFLDPTNKKEIGVILSGVDPNLDQGLLNQLKTISDNKDDSIFLVPSFKHISRNIEKVFKVLEFLLYIDVPIVTPNYLCTPQKISVRNPFLKPIHYNRNFKKVLANTTGTTKEHKKILKNIAKNMN